MLIDQLLTEHPGLAEVFVQHLMLCVGCDMGRFHTLAEAAKQYSITPDAFIAELKERLAGGEIGAGSPG